MLKAKALITDGDQAVTLFIIGLSAKNVERLMEKKPIVFDCKELGLPDLGRIAIVYGTTEAEIERDILAAGGQPRESF